MTSFDGGASFFTFKHELELKTFKIKMNPCHIMQLVESLFIFIKLIHTSIFMLVHGLYFKNKRTYTI
jgi:hypothetical protein